MNERIKELAVQAGFTRRKFYDGGEYLDKPTTPISSISIDSELGKFAELIVRKMCGLMEQAEDDAYHCFDASERPTEYIEWLRDWQERFEKHFGVEE